MRPTSRRLVLGVVLAHCPDHSAGNVWFNLNWALGFRSLGWDVWLVEHLDRAGLAPGPDPGGESRNERLWRETIAEFGFEGRASLFLDGEADNRAALERFADGALFINLSGQFKLHALVAACPRRVYVDVDPVFTQLWASFCGCDMNFEGHTDFFSVGALIGQPAAHLPRTGHDWQPTLPPVCLDHWSPQAAESWAKSAPAGRADARGAWTTVTHWYGYNGMNWDGRYYGNKRDSLLALRDLPRRAGIRLQVASDMQPGWEDHDAFAAAGWEFVPTATVCGDWRVYRDFLWSGEGEISVAKGGYVVSGSGWFSDRSVCYLALGRPVLLQETGWSQLLPCGDGLRSFRDIDEAAAALDDFRADPARHALAARRIAEEHLDAKRVIGQFLDRLGP